MNFYHIPLQIGKHVRPQILTDAAVQAKCNFRYHFLHSLALFTVQFSSVPKITAALFIAGQLLFCVLNIQFSIFTRFLYFTNKITIYFIKMIYN